MNMNMNDIITDGVIADVTCNLNSGETFDFQVRKFATAQELVSCTSTIAETITSVDSKLGDYTPELREVIRLIALVKTYTNIDADSMDIDMFMLLMLNSDLLDVLRNNINPVQLMWIDSGVDARISHALRKTGADKLFDKIVSMVDTWDTALSTPQNIEAVNKLIAQLGGIDIQGLAQALIGK